MQFEKLALTHKVLLHPKLSSMGICLSEYHFGCLFLFRRTHDYQLARDENLLWIRGKTRDGITYLMPTEDIRQIPSEVLLKKLKWAQCFFPIPESWIPAFDPNFFEASFNRDDSDYIFCREKIAEYPGRDLSAKRNLLKQFLSAYTPTVIPYQTQYYRDALAVLDIWQSKMGEKETDYDACKDGLKYADELGLSGYLIYVEGQPAGFILGEMAGTLYTIHFAKADVQYKGIYQFLFKELASRLPAEETCCLNWEQDLGEEGLRKSKLSYQPDKLANKYRIFPRL